jgi:cysteinyl-tRNA synthetase
MAERVWRQPHDAVCNGGGHAASPTDGRLVLYNSLIDRKVPFVPIAGPHSKNITWYTCGPTVYDSTHMGHARNYLAFDIVRRVLEDYFGYNVMFIMNVTDVDDKIILRARRNHLLAEYLRDRGTDTNALLADATAALSAAEAKQRAKAEKARSEADAAEAEAAAEGSATAAKRRDGFLEAAASEELLLAKTQGDVAKLRQLVSGAASKQQLPGQEDVLAVASDALAADLDAQHGTSVTDPAIFRGHAARFEAAFLEDMATLGVRPPTVFTRVSEYIPEIVEYIEKIVTNGLAYESSGSVYFDTQAFIAAGHTYGKLNPWAVGSALAAEPNEPGADKRHPCDFALWKAAKPGEPTWESPWGRGRPGWHIECSAMASAIAGSQLDIHTGGEDLRFPHHDNELAQAEAYFHCEGCCQWVNYFLHSGHLGIEGLKMSKSLKNFVTVREALETFTPRQLRLMMILTSWDRRMAYGEHVREEMRARESQLRNFFANVDVVLRRAEGGVAAPGHQKWRSEENTLSAALDTAAAAVHARFLDSIDTRGAMDALSDLIKATNTYLAARQDASGPPAQAFLLRQVAGFVTRILSVLGVTAAAADNVGLGSSDGVGNGTAGEDARVSAVLDAFCEFRDEVRKLARSGAAHKDVLAACDTVRDNAMVDLGVRLEDQADGGSVWKNDDPAVLRAEREEKAAAAKAAAARKVKSKWEGLKRDLDKFEKLAALPSAQEALAEKYSRFDDVTGEPTHDASGSVLEGKALDKARKDLEKAKKVRAPLEKRIADDGPEFWNRMKADIAALEEQLAALEASAPSV